VPFVLFKDKDADQRDKVSREGLETKHKKYSDAHYKKVGEEIAFETRGRK
jgi:hypothetical protein